jgi:hypothetical protein
MSRLLSFPNPVNEVAARTVACGVVVLTLLAISLRSPIVLGILCYGFWARVLTGPKLSPLGQLATRVIAPRLSAAPTFVPGPPKRFAQAIGAAVTTGAVVLWATVGWTPAAWLLVVLLVAASLEGFAGYCLGCTIFRWLIQFGVVPETVCEECSNLDARYRRLSAGT